MIDEIFVFDNVVHMHDMSDANLRQDVPDAEWARAGLLGLGELFRHVAPNDLDHRKAVSVDEMYEAVFLESPTDLAMAQVVPIFDWFKDWWAPVRLNYELARAYPERVLFCGGVDPNWRGLDQALRDMEFQVKEWGAVSMKFYSGHEEGTWRCDDRELAYPLYEKAQQLGINVLQFHKGNPFGLQNVESTRPNDLQAAARDFPDLTFVVHHLALPYFDEMVNIAARFPNIHLALSAMINFILISPRMVQERLGRLLMEVGSGKLIWGSEASLGGPPRAYLEAVMALEIPDDLRVGYGFPQFTREDKRKFLGENFARLMGIDLEQKKRELYGSAEAVGARAKAGVAAP
jgi:predicted TIM-barrel fold metal-dependent hydrolase